MSLFNVKSTPTFERGFKILTKRNHELLIKFVDLLAILTYDPYNISGRHNIKKLTNVSKGEGQWRIRMGKYRLRYDIINEDVVLHSLSHRKEAY
jgi:mRNA-degrading endonuclease RelE of RelBE toxin-antitoxin system